VSLGAQGCRVLSKLLFLDRCVFFLGVLRSVLAMYTWSSLLDKSTPYINLSFRVKNLHCWLFVVLIIYYLGTQLIDTHSC
jgi:hypothetical protein